MNIRQVEISDNIPLSNLIRNVFIEHNAQQNGTVYSDLTTDNLYELFNMKKSVLWVAEIDEKIVKQTALQYRKLNI